MKKVIVITGASSGFGEMTAVALARAGHNVYAGFQSLEQGRDKAEEYRLMSQQESLQLQPLELNISKQESVDTAVAEVLSRDGKVDVLIQNAGHMSFGPAEAFTVEQLADLYDTNALGTQRLNRAALPHMRNAGEGLLVWVSSSSVRGNWSPYFSGYFAAKAAMEQFAMSYAAELAPFGIETTIVVPGVFTKGTNHFASALKPGDETVAEAYEGGPAKGLGDALLKASASTEPADADPSEVARAIVRVVNTPFGKRPFRITIDPAQDGSEIVAAVQDRLRQDTLNRLGLGYLLSPRQSPAKN